MAAEQSPATQPANGDNGVIELRLYIAGQTRKSIAALTNLRRICEEVRRLPEPIRRIIGDLSNSERVLVGLEVEPKPREVR